MEIYNRIAVVLGGPRRTCDCDIAAWLQENKFPAVILGS